MNVKAYRVSEHGELIRPGDFVYIYWDTDKKDYRAEKFNAIFHAHLRVSGLAIEVNDTTVHVVLFPENSV